MFIKINTFFMKIIVVRWGNGYKLIIKLLYYKIDYSKVSVIWAPIFWGSV